MSNVARYELRATEDSVGLFATEKPNTHGMQYVTASAYDALLAERDALSASSAKWKRDSELLNAIETECWDVRFLSTPNADAGDSSISIEIVGHFMAEPCERVVGENYNENLRAALEQAMTAEAYPPARPEYDDRGRHVAALQGEQP